MSPVTTRALALLCILQCTTHLAGYSNLTKNDPYPVYTALYPYTFLTNNERDFLKGIEPIHNQEWFCLSLSPFRQSAVFGRDINKKKTNLGDLLGNWNMLALFYPGMNASGGTNSTNVVQSALLSALGLTDNAVTTTCSGLFDPSKTDTKHEFGFFDVPIKYRKYGIRMELDVQLFCDLGIQLLAGVSDTIQTATFNDLTCIAVGTQCDIVEDACPPATTNATCPRCCCNIDNQITCDCKRLVIQKIMRQKDIIAKTLCLGIKNFSHRGLEDTRISLYWRHLFAVNQELERFPYFILMPFFAFEVTLPSGHKIDPNCLFALPSGNNGHTGIGFSSGLNFDFVETIEIGIQASMTTWNSRCYRSFPVPVNELQAGMFPYKADLTIKPGTNWTFSALMHARHFLDWLSVWAQWVVVTHGRDQFCTAQILPFNATDTTPPVPLLNKLSDESKWHSHVMNVGATYDISPNIALGLLWQAPLSQRNAYRSTTIMGSIIITW